MKLIKPDYKNSIMAVSNSFLKYYDIKTNYPSLTMLDERLKLEKPNHIIYVLLDGMGYNIVQKLLKPEDALRKYCLKGITSVFPPTTVAATNAVISATPPIENGHIGWVQYFPKEDVNLAVFLNKDFYDFDREIKDHLQSKYLSYESIIDKIGKETDTNASILFPSFVEGGSDSFDEEIEKALLINNNTDKSFTYVYWTQPDLIEHVSGIYSKETKSMLESLNDSFTDLINNVSDDTMVVCIADHGLTDIEEIPLNDYKSLTNMLIRKPSIEPRAINFFVKPNCIESFKDEFLKHFRKSFKLLSKTEFIESGLIGNGPKHNMIDSFIGDYVGIAIDKYMFTLATSKKYKSHHAGLTEDEMIVPLIVYSKKG